MIIIIIDLIIFLIFSNDVGVNSTKSTYIMSVCSQHRLVHNNIQFKCKLTDSYSWYTLYIHTYKYD